MLGLKKIAVTGGLSSGKTTVCKLFKELGAYTLSADEIVHDLLSFSPKVIADVTELFGEKVITQGKLDRKKIADLVFRDANLLKKLEQILHPEVRKYVDKEYRDYLQQGKTGLFIVEIPLLYEVNQQTNYDKVITVYADDKRCESRYLAKNHMQDYNKRKNQQLSLEEKIKKADYVIYNQGTISDLKNSVKQIYNQLISNSST